MSRTLETLYASDWMEYRPGELFNPPGITNFWGSCQASTGVMAIQNLIFPPYSQGDVRLGTLTLNGCCFATAGVPIRYRWHPDRIEREAKAGPLAVRTATALQPGAQVCAIRLIIRNTAADPETVRMRVRSGDGVIHSATGWNTPYPPKEKPTISVTPWEGTPPPEQLLRNLVNPDPENGRITMVSQTSKAYSLQSLVPAADRVEGVSFHATFDLQPSEERCFYYLVAVGDDEAALNAAHQALEADPETVFQEAATEWAGVLKAAFTPGNDRFSGHLPKLVTTNPDLEKIYHNAILAALIMRREHPEAAYGPTYVTLFPGYWQTTSFINDWSLSSRLLVMLDPDTVQSQLEMWLQRDIYSHFGTEYVSGNNAGNWYSCNDYAMTRLISDFVRFSGRREWLHQKVGATTVLGHLKTFALHYEKLLDPATGLADYGDRNSLLEAVGSYEHQVASLNAANVWILREVAGFLEEDGDPETAADYRRRAGIQAERTLALFNSRTGSWDALRPDGSRVEVRHIWDWIHTLNLMGDALSTEQQQALYDTFLHEHWTPNWCRALSPLDDDIDFSLRPDHQWNGSFPAWVALAGEALVKMGRPEQLAAWLPGLAASANQGPYAQAHFTNDYASPIGTGARKAPLEWPYITDWGILVGGAFFDMILNAIFGIHPGTGSLAATPNLESIDPHASLEGFCYAGKLYTINATEGVVSKD